MKRHNNGRKTPGGVFIALLKQHPDIDQIELAKVIDKHSTWKTGSKQKKLREQQKSEALEKPESTENPPIVSATPPEPTLSAPMFFSAEANLY